MNTVDNNQRSEKIILWLIILAAAALRLMNIGEVSLSNDELSSLSRIKYDSFSEMIHKGVYIDFHPAGLQAFLFYWVKIFGDDQFILRLPFVFAGLVSIWLIYKIGKLWFSGLSALMAASCFAFLSFIMLFSQLARMYSPAIMFSLLTVYCWTNFLSQENVNRNKWYIGWILSMICAIHLQYFSFLFVGLVGASGLFIVRKDDRTKYLIGGIIAFLTFAFEISIFLEQMKTGDIGGWLGPPTKKFLPQFFFELFNRSIIICVFILIFIIWGAVSGVKKENANRWRWLSTSWFVISFLIAYLYSVSGHPVLMFSTMLFATPFFLLTMFSFVPATLLKPRNVIITATVFALLLIYDTVVPARFFSKKQFGVFKETTEDAEAWAKKYGKENVPVVVNVINPDYADYYFRRMKDPPKVVTHNVELPADFSKLYDMLNSSASPYFAYIWCNSSHPQEVPEIIRSYYPFLVEKKIYFNAASYLFGKNPGESNVITELFSSVCDYDQKLWSGDTNSLSSDHSHSGKISERMNNEFSWALHKSISEIAGQGLRYVVLSAWVFSEGDVGDAKLAISFDKNGKSDGYRASLIKDFNIKRGEWSQVILTMDWPENTSKDDVLTAYIWNSSRKLFYIDDLKIEVHQGDDPYEQFNQWRRRLLYRVVSGTSLMAMR